MGRPNQSVFSTPQKARFYYAYDHKEPTDSILDVCNKDDDFPSTATAKRWLRRRHECGEDIAVRRSSKAGHTPRGRPRKDVDTTVKEIAHKSRDAREQA